MTPSTEALFLLALVQLSPTSGFDCLETNEPVCGSDGKTYNNGCFAEAMFWPRPMPKDFIKCRGKCPCGEKIDNPDTKKKLVCVDEKQNVVRMRYDESRERWTINHEVPSVSSSQPPQEIGQDAGKGDAVALYTIQARRPTRRLRMCSQSYVLKCHIIKINRAALGADNISVRDFSGNTFTMPKEFSGPSAGRGKTASYGSLATNPGTSATLTWRVRRVRGNAKSYTSVHGFIRLPSDEPQGGNYQIANCGSGCQVLIRFDQTHLHGKIF